MHSVPIARAHHLLPFLGVLRGIGAPVDLELARAKRDAGVGLNDVAYFSEIQNWKIDFTTNNNTTPYIHFFWNAEQEPIVIEISPSTEDVELVGTLLDFWQRSVIAVGAAGYDGGRGGKYLVMSADYQGSYPEGYIAVYQKTFNGSATLRPIIRDTSPANLKKVTEFVQGIQVYPLSEADNPPATRHVDIYDVRIDGLPHFDASYFTDLNDIYARDFVSSGGNPSKPGLGGYSVDLNSMPAIYNIEYDPARRTT